MTTALAELIGKKPRRADEEVIQKALVERLRLMASPDVIWYAVPNGGYATSAATGARLKAMGLRPGTPDLAFVLSDGHAAFMELKQPTGSLSPAQVDFKIQCERMGVEHAVCFDIDTAVRVLEAWGVLPSEVTPV